MDWEISPGLMDYDSAVKRMEARVAAIRSGIEPELVWLVEHPPLYTAGTSAKSSDLLDHKRFPVYETGRGGEYTYHGPGQRVGYVMIDLKKSGGVPDIRRFVNQLEEWLIRTLAEFGIKGERREGRIGIWVETPKGGEAKVGALGIRVRRGVTYHGVALNVNPDLNHFTGIVPCGIRGFGVTSLADLGVDVSMHDVDDALKRQWDEVFR